MGMPTENRADQPCFALKPANPNCGVTPVGWTMPNDKPVIRVPKAEAKVPSEIFLLGTVSV